MALSNEQAFEKKQAQNQKLHEIIESTGHHNKEFRHLDSGLRTFENFEIKPPIGIGSLVAMKSDLYGAKTGTYFEFPELIKGAQSSLQCPNDFRDRVVTKVSACVGVGIYSVQLSYSDGCVSPLLGKRKINADTELLPGEMQATRIQHWAENYVQALTFLDSNRNTLGSLECQGGKGQVDEFLIPENKKIIGIYGYQDKNMDVRGLGFILTDCT